MKVRQEKVPVSIPLLETQANQCRWIEPDGSKPIMTLVRNGVRRARREMVTSDR